MNEPRYFVLVFGDPEQNGDTVESGQYAAGDNYPPFTVEAGDLLLLYCTEGYSAYSKQVPGIGVAIRANPQLIEYRWIPFAQSIPRTSIANTFAPDDQEKMRQLRFNVRRAFEISRQSFVQTVANRPLAGS